MRFRAHVVTWLFLAGCSIGAPPGFSGGESWTLPLVGPLEDGLLVTPVTVNGHGPYLFAIDPDAPISAVDAQVVREAHLWSGLGPHRVDETNTGRPRFYVELLDVRLAGLTIDRRDAMVFAVGTYDTEDRHISGIVGRDVLADSLAFGFDRDQGVAILSTMDAFHPPAGVPSIQYELTGHSAAGPRSQPLWRYSSSRADASLTVPRRVAVADIDGQRFTMHLDLGAAVSQLAESRWARGGLAPVAAHLRLSDEAATTREVERLGVARTVTLDGATTHEVAFAPYIEQRFPLQYIDGALGLDFFRPFTVFVDWDHRTYYMKPRGDAAAMTVARIGRWGAAVPACPHPGCVTAEVIATGAGPALHVVRDAEAANHALEVFLAATGGSAGRGASSDERSAAPLVVELPAGTDQLTSPVPAAYAGAALAVLDVSPFPRVCPTQDGCVLPLGGPEAPAAHPEPAMHRLATRGQ